jgi:hypothetical protein
MDSDPKTPPTKPGPVQVLDSGPLAVVCPTCYMPPGCRCALVLPVSTRILGTFHPQRARLARWLDKPDATDLFIKQQMIYYRNYLAAALGLIWD